MASERKAGASPGNEVHIRRSTACNDFSPKIKVPKLYQKNYNAVPERGQTTERQEQKIKELMDMVHKKQYGLLHIDQALSQMTSPIKSTESKNKRPQSPRFLQKDFLKNYKNVLKDS